MKIESYGVIPYDIIDGKIYILLAQSSKKQSYGSFKGKMDKGETIKQTAIRELYEESYIKVEEKYLEKFFYQKNKSKNVGVFLINVNNIENFSSFLSYGILKKFNHENYQSKMFDINYLPDIHKNQSKIISDLILDFKNSYNSYKIFSLFLNRV